MACAAWSSVMMKTMFGRSATTPEVADRSNAASTQDVEFLFALLQLVAQALGIALRRGFAFAGRFQQLDGLAAKSRCQYSIECCRRPAALQVTEDNRSRFLAGQLFQFRGDSMPGTAQTLGATKRCTLDQ